MTCSLFDVPCHVWGFIAPFWLWIQMAFLVLVAALALWGLSKVKEVAGWPGVAAVAGAAIYAFGWFRGRSGKSINPLENIGPGSPDAAQATSRALTRDEVRRLQRGLNAKGFNPGPVDGKPGRRTREAIRQYQMSRGEPATGIPTAAHLKALGAWK